jgi:hypothetical protein
MTSVLNDVAPSEKRNDAMRCAYGVDEWGDTLDFLRLGVIGARLSVMVFVAIDD